MGHQSLLVSHSTPSPLIVANKDTYEVVRLYMRHNKGLKASLRQNKGVSCASSRFETS